jgi:hypothetical protein
MDNFYTVEKYSCQLMYDPLWSPFENVKQRYKLSVGADFGQNFNWLLCVNHLWYMENIHKLNN